MRKCPADFNFFDENVLNCPYDFYQALQEQAPVCQLPDTNIFMVSRHPDVIKLLKDTETYSNNFGEQLKGPEPDPAVAEIYQRGWQQVDTMITVDPPRHKTYRTLVNKVFNQKRVNAMEEYMQTSAAVIHKTI